MFGVIQNEADDVFNNLPAPLPRPRGSNINNPPSAVSPILPPTGVAPVSGILNYLSATFGATNNGNNQSSTI